jgi:4-hydroxy-tetrahydrodipicolinate synthase
MNGPFGTVITAMITPFGENGELNVSEAIRLAKWLVEQGNDALVITGTTGEVPTLTDDEKITMWREISKAVSVPVIAGTGTNNTVHSVELTKQAESVGVAGILAVTPYYNRPSQAGISAHFGAIAESTELPILLYDIPIRTGRKIAYETLISLSHQHKNIVGVKDAAGDVAASGRLLAESSLCIYSGEDALTLPLISVGACGVIGVATHWATPQFVEMFQSFWKGDVTHAERVNDQLAESCAFETGDLNPNPIPAKAMMRTLGFAVGECRLPMGPTPSGLEDRAREVFARLAS